MYNISQMFSYIHSTLKYFYILYNIFNVATRKSKTEHDSLHVSLLDGSMLYIKDIIE